MFGQSCDLRFVVAETKGPSPKAGVATGEEVEDVVVVLLSWSMNMGVGALTRVVTPAAMKRKSGI